jgi:hypothetical protein
MDMLRVFFEKTDKDTSIYFKDKKIWACGSKYREYQGKYPVIFLTFKDIKFNTWEETFDAIKDLFSKETSRHPELLNNEKLSVSDKKRIDSLVAGDCSVVELSSALATLCVVLMSIKQRAVNGDYGGIEDTIGALVVIAVVFSVFVVLENLLMMGLYKEKD